MSAIRIALLACLSMLVTAPAQSQTYHLGPRGGCYTTTASGTKRYVDHSLCSPATVSGSNQQAVPRPFASAKYMRGPRGGCYTLTPNGNKRYVDRSLCN